MLSIFKNKNIQTKLLFTYGPLTILPMLILILVGYWFFSKEMENEIGGYVFQTVYQVNNHVDTYLEELERLSLNPYYNTDVMDIMNEQSFYHDDVDKFYTRKLMDQFLSDAFVNPRGDILGVFIYKLDGSIFYRSGYQDILNPKYNWEDAFWLDRALEANGKAVFLGRQDNLVQNPTSRTFSVARTIKSRNEQTLGAIIIYANFKGLETIFNEVGLGKKSNFVVLDQDNSVLYSRNHLYMDSISVVDLTDSQLEKISVEQDSILVATSISHRTGWKVMGMVPFSELNYSIITIRNIIFLISLILILVVCLATVWISQGITKPLRILRTSMKELEQGNYQVSVNQLSKDEIGDLGVSFNKMRERIDELVNQILEIRYQHKEAELHNLKTQIRPHFLYNTLESIRALAELDENYEIIEMTSALGSLLRYSIKEHRPFVKIEKELQFIRDYLKIQKIRFGDMLAVEIDVDEVILDYYTIPILLQPIIENAILHGIRVKNRGGMVAIEGKVVDQNIVFKIRDNGVGLTLKRVQELNQFLSQDYQMEGNHDGEIGIGLLNISRRLRILFGEGYGIHFKCHQGDGTLVIVTIPILTQANKPTDQMIKEDV